MVEDGVIFSSRDSNAMIRECCPGCEKKDPNYVATFTRAANRFFVDQCAKRAPLNEVKRVDTFHYTLCNRKKILARYQGSGVSYILSRQIDGVHIAFKTRLEIEPRHTPDARAKLLLERVRECVPVIQSVWARYGVQLHMLIDSDRHPIPGNDDYNVTLWDTLSGDRRANAGNLYFWDQPKTASGRCLDLCLSQKYATLSACEVQCEPLRKNDFCLTMLHESGHWLGLSDEYEENGYCPDRPRIAAEQKPGSIMDDQRKGLENIEFFPRHVKTVVEPLCR